MKICINEEDKIMSKIEIKEKDGRIFCPLKNDWLISTPEEKVRQKYITILVNEYGYLLSQMAQELKVTNSQRGQGAARADIVVWKSVQDKDEQKNAFIVVECKAENVRIHEEDYFQGFNYASWAGASFFVTTNEKETKYFNVDKNYIPKELVEVVALPTSEEATNDKKIKELLNKTKTFTREEFTKTLRACHNIIRNNDKLSPEAAFDEISKILFMKIKYEREQRGTRVFTKAQFITDNENHEKNYRPILKGTLKDIPYMQWMFEQTKEEFKDDHIFDEIETIKIRQNSFEQILEKLETYNLSDTQDDVKGIAFEQFLGTTFRGELGQFFTPRTIVDFMTHIIDPMEGEIICDPTCGSGGFLIKAFEYVRDKIEKDVKTSKDQLRQSIEGENYESLSEEEQLTINEKIETMQSILNEELNTQCENSRMFNLSHNCIYGTDANPRMARTSKMNMIMHGDGHGGVHHHDGLLNVNGIFEERFDVILTNPPFGARIDKEQKISEADKFIDVDLIKKYREKYGYAYDNALKQVNDNIGKSLLGIFDVGKMSGLTEVLFMERCLRLLKKGGRLGMVLPEGVLNTSNLQKVREYFEGQAKIILICSIPQDVFIAAGATVKPSLVFLKRFTEQEEKLYASITQKAHNEVRSNYSNEISCLENELAQLNERVNNKIENKTVIRSKIKEINKRLASIENSIIEEAKPLIKEYFDYEIPVAIVEDAGITSTGAASNNNQLIPLQEEYKTYRSKNSLWYEKDCTISYIMKEGGKLVRISDGKEVELKW
jgi:type I restriction enzyme M protein